MKKYVLFLAVMIMASNVIAQNIGIGTTTPNASAALEINATGKGLLIPRTSTTTRTAIVNPAKGLMVYDTTTNSFWYHNGSAWTQIDNAGTGWSLTGNSGTNTSSNFIGTTDNQPLRFRIKNIYSGEIDSANNKTLIFSDSFKSLFL